MAPLLYDARYLGGAIFNFLKVFLVLLFILATTPTAIADTDSSVWKYEFIKSVDYMAFSEDGNYAICSVRDNNTYLFDMKNLELLWKYDTNDMVLAVDISYNGSYAIVGSKSPDNTAYLFSNNNNTPINQYKTESAVHAVAISDDSQYYAVSSGCPGCANHLYFFKKGQDNPLWDYYSGRNVIISIDISSDGQYIVIGNLDHETILFNRASSSPIWKHTANDIINSVAISNEGQYIVTGSSDNRVYFFDKTNSTPLWNYKADGRIRSVAISGDGEGIVAGSRYDKVLYFNRNSSIPIWYHMDKDGMISVSISDDGNNIAYGTDFNKIYAFNKNSNKPMWSYATNKQVFDVALSSNGKYIAAISYDRTFYYINVNNMTQQLNDDDNNTSLHNTNILIIIFSAVLLLLVVLIVIIHRKRKNNSLINKLWSDNTNTASITSRLPSLRTEVQSSILPRSPQPPPDSSAPASVMIECPICQDRMAIPKLGKLQQIKCESCGQKGELKV